LTHLDACVTLFQLSGVTVMLRSGRDLKGEHERQDLISTDAHFPYLHVAASTLGEASGSGLFTRLAIKKGAAVVRYYGHLVLRESRPASSYVASYSSTQSLDAAAVVTLPTTARRNLGRYCNDARQGGGANNLSFTAAWHDADGYFLVMTALRFIAAEEELFLAYGTSYWH